MAKLETAIYVVTRRIAERSGMLGTRYRTTDGRFILNDRDLSRVYFTPDEYINGLQGVEKITKNEADGLIKGGGYKMGDEGLEQRKEEMI